MPTFQSTPPSEWIFPDEAYNMNRRVGMFEVPSGPPLNETGHHVASHSEWAELARREALARVVNNKLKEEGMLGHGAMNDRSQRYKLPASRSAVHNGVFEGPAMLYAANAGLMGGRIYTKEGQEWLDRRLQERRNEFITLSSGQFRSRPTPRATLVSPDTNSIDTYIQELLTALATDVFSSRTTEIASKLFDAFIKEGASLDENQLGRYMRILEEMDRTTRGRVDAPGLEPFGGRTQEVRRILDYVNRYVNYSARVLYKLSTVINEPQNVRQNVLDLERSAILRVTERRLYPGAEQVPPPQMGQQYPPQPEVEALAPRFPILQRLARLGRPAPPAPYPDLEEIGRRGEV